MAKHNQQLYAIRRSDACRNSLQCVTAKLKAMFATQHISARSICYKRAGDHNVSDNAGSQNRTFVREKRYVIQCATALSLFTPETRPHFFVKQNAPS